MIDNIFGELMIQDKFQNIALSEVLFLSDIECLDDTWSKKIFEDCEKSKIKLIVLIGDMLSNILGGTQDDIKNIIENKLLFYEFAKVYKSESIKSNENLRIYDNGVFSKILSKYFKEAIINRTNDSKKDFLVWKSFIKYCSDNKIDVVFYSGNHDYIVWYLKEKEKLNLIKDLWGVIRNFYIPQDQELISLKDGYFIMGIHTKSDDESTNIFKELESGNLLDNTFPEKTIFVSHIPCTGKFSKRGSEEITNFKVKNKFFYHIHGHCKNYYKEYLSSGIPTISVDENIVLGKNIYNKQKTLL